MTAPDPSSVRIPGVWRHFDVRANGIRFHAAEVDDAGSADRPLVLLLHGFGEFWWSWRNQISDLHDAGYRAVAVDLRGYGDTDKPPRGYDGWTLAGDTNGLIRALGHSDATLVGHADGGLVCWATATLHPRMVTAIAVISSPHPRALRHDVLYRRRQRKAFLGGFLRNQIPRAGERRLTHDSGAYLGTYLAERAAESWRATEDFATAVDRNRSAMQIPSVAHCSLEYQRWAFRSQFRPEGARFADLMNRRLQIPVLALRGADDEFITDHTMRASSHWAADMTYRLVGDAAHFAHEEQPAKLTAELTQLLNR